MKFTLSIECADAAELSEVTARLNGEAAPDAFVSGPAVVSTATGAVTPAPVVPTSAEILAADIDTDDAPAAPPLPVATAPETAPAAPAGIELDAAGIAWDARIHSSGKALLKNGRWKSKRGVDAALVASVEAEQSGAVAAPLVNRDENDDGPTPTPPPAPAAPVADTPPPAPVAPAAPVAPTVAPVAPAAPPVPVAPAAPVAPVAAPVAAPAAPAAVDPALTMAGLMQRVMMAQQQGLSPEALQAACVDLGASNYPDITQKPELWGALLAKVEAK